MRKELISELEAIIREKRLQITFQPVISLRDGSVFGYESRPILSPRIVNVKKMFHIAEKCHLAADLQWLYMNTVFSALKKSDQFSRHERVMITIIPSVVSSKEFRRELTEDYFKYYHVSPDQLVLQIDADSWRDDSDQLRRGIIQLKERHIHIAVVHPDMLNASLHLMREAAPQYVRLDGQTIRDLAAGQLNFAYVSGVMEFCRMAAIQPISTDVETMTEVNSLIELDVPYVQGNFFGKPAAAPQKPDADLVKIITARMRHRLGGNLSLSNRIAEICKQTETIGKDIRVETVFDKIRDNPAAIGFCVVDDNYVIGIVTRIQLMLALSGRFGFSLYQHRPIVQLMDSNFISVDCCMPISAVSKLAMARAQERLYDFIVVTKMGRYFGTVTVKDLLQRSTEIEVNKAKYENALTGLPGNLLIEQRVSGMLASDEAQAVVYLDINHFKEYNDVYGFESGDKIIKLLADILIANRSIGEFVGHIGGDDFVAILHPDHAAAYCQSVSRLFTEKIQVYYRADDCARGYIVAENRQGRVEQFSLISVAVAGLIACRAHFVNARQLTGTLAQLKKRSKQGTDNHFLLIDMRECSEDYKN
ncbi:MAG: GGDEF domain-containing protein [Sporolactobacillus sp.]